MQNTINEYNYGLNLLELAMEISLTSLGSSQTLRRPQLSTEAASRFCSLRDTILPHVYAITSKTKESETTADVLFKEEPSRVTLATNR